LLYVRFDILKGVTVNIGRSSLKVKAACSLDQSLRRHSISAPRHRK